MTSFGSCTEIIHELPFKKVFCCLTILFFIYFLLFWWFFVVHPFRRSIKLVKLNNLLAFEVVNVLDVEILSYLCFLLDALHSQLLRQINCIFLKNTKC